MRYFCSVVCLLALALPASAQHSHSLPAIGGSLPAIGLPPPSWDAPRVPSWEVPRTPAWEVARPPSWEKSHVARPDSGHSRRRGRAVPTQVIYVYQPYPVAPQVVFVERPVERIVEVEVPVEKIVVVEPLPSPEVGSAPQPTGSRIVYVIPGCYVGNVAPQDVKLPASCDLSKLTTFTP